MEKDKTSVSEREMESFKAMGSSWWDPDGPIGGLLKQKAQNTIPYILKGLSEVNAIEYEDRTSKKALENFKILDVGCGGGFLAEEMANLKAEVTALDPCSDLILVAKDHAVRSGLAINYSDETVEEHCTKSKEKYDIVTCIEVLDHVTDVRSVVKSSVECLKPGGTIFISTINRTIFAWFVLIFIYEIVFKLVPRGGHHLSMFIKPKEVEDILADYGCKVLNVEGTWIDPFTGTWIPFFSKSALYSLYAVKEDSKKLK